MFSVTDPLYSVIFTLSERGIFLLWTRLFCWTFKDEGEGKFRFGFQYERFPHKLESLIFYFFKLEFKLITPGEEVIYEFVDSEESQVVKTFTLDNPWTKTTDTIRITSGKRHTYFSKYPEHQEIYEIWIPDEESSKLPYVSSFGIGNKLIKNQRVDEFEHLKFVMKTYYTYNTIRKENQTSKENEV